MTLRGLVSKEDLGASVVVLLVALPLCMGVAIASGMSPGAGLIAGIIGGLVVGAIGGSPLQVSGPAAGLSVLVWGIIEDFGFAAFGGILLLAGVLQAVAGLLGAGKLFRAISPAVVYGMLAGIGVLIVVSQLQVMVDDKPLKSGFSNLLAVPSAIAKGLTGAPNRTHRAAALLGALTIATIIAWNRIKPARLRWLPGPLLAVVLAAVVASSTGMQVQLVTIPEGLLGTTYVPSIATLSNLLTSSQLLAAVSLAIVASAETLLCTGAVDRMQESVRADYDRELFAQGIGNSLCGVLGALPITGVIVRSSANIEAGARSRASTMLHGLWVLAIVVLFPGALRLIPTSSLAGVLVYTGFKLVNPAQIRELRQFGWQSIAIYAVTLTGIVATDLLTGVLVGVALSLLRLLLRLGSFSLTAQPGEGRVDVQLEGAITFVGLPRLAAKLDALPPCFAIHLHLTNLTYIDHACLVTIADFVRRRRRDGMTIHIDWAELEARSEKVINGDLVASSEH